MAFNVIFTDEADDTFDSIGNQILERWGESELFKFRARVYEVVDTIGKSRLIFQAVDNIANLRKAVIHKNCSLYYKINEKRIVLLIF